MSSYIAVQKSAHQNAGYSPMVDFSFAAEMSTVPLLIDELNYVLQQMCVAFQKRTKGSEDYYELVGLQSFSPGKNSFLLPDGRWLGGYKPAFYRAQPFALQPEDQGNQLQLSIKSDCVILDPAVDDLRFFQEDMELTPRMKEVVKFLTETLRSRQTTMALCRALQKANLIVPWSFSFSQPDNNNKPQEKMVGGLYHIDSDALKALPAEQLTALNASGALSLAYGQIFSEARLRDMAKLETAQRQLQQKQVQGKSPELDLNALFGDKDEVFSF